MKEMRYGGNIFLLPKGPEAAVVTTNGMVRKDGLAVMGAGIAKYARDNLRGIDSVLGTLLSRNGNHAYFLGGFADDHRRERSLPATVFVLSMPTKRDWREKSDPYLIRQSAAELVAVADSNRIEKIYLPAPGCSNGGLDYGRQVRPVIRNILDDRFTVCLAPELFDAVRGREA